jgi:hypothetical protein
MSFFYCVPRWLRVGLSASSPRAAGQQHCGLSALIPHVGHPADEQGLRLRNEMRLVKMFTFSRFLSFEKITTNKTRILAAGLLNNSTDPAVQSQI